MENFDHILLFKTDIDSEACEASLKNILDAQTGIEKWNIALDDEDRVLRVVSYTLTHQEIINLITQHGHSCCELT